MNDLAGPDRRQITIALIREHRSLRADPFDTRCHSRRATVGCLRKIDVQVVICQHRTADRCDANRTFPDPQLVDHFRNDPVDHPVQTARAIMCVNIAQGFGPLEHYLFRHNDLPFSTCGSPCTIHAIRSDDIAG